MVVASVACTLDLISRQSRIQAAGAASLCSGLLGCLFWRLTNQCRLRRTGVTGLPAAAMGGGIKGRQPRASAHWAPRAVGPGETKAGRRGRRAAPGLRARPVRASPGDLIGWPAPAGSESPRGLTGTPRRLSAAAAAAAEATHARTQEPRGRSTTRPPASVESAAGRSPAPARAPCALCARTPPNCHRTFWKRSPTAAPAADRARRLRERLRPWRPLGRGAGRGLPGGGALERRLPAIRRLRAGPASRAPWLRPFPPPLWRLPGSFIRRRACWTPVLRSRRRRLPPSQPTCPAPPQTRRPPSRSAGKTEACGPSPPFPFARAGTR